MTDEIVNDCGHNAWRVVKIEMGVGVKAVCRKCGRVAKIMERVNL